MRLSRILLSRDIRRIITSFGEALEPFDLVCAERTAMPGCFPGRAGRINRRGIRW
jgi:hypothetical protein